jgi:hypothetical protein
VGDSEGTKVPTPQHVWAGGSGGRGRRERGSEVWDPDGNRGVCALP